MFLCQSTSLFTNLKLSAFWVNPHSRPRHVPKVTWNPVGKKKHLGKSWNFRFDLIFFWGGAIHRFIKNCLEVLNLVHWTVLRPPCVQCPVWCDKCWVAWWVKLRLLYFTSSWCKKPWICQECLFLKVEILKTTLKLGLENEWWMFPAPVFCEKVEI